MIPHLYHRSKERLYYFKEKKLFYSKLNVLVLLIFILPACIKASKTYLLIADEDTKVSSRIALDNSVFHQLDSTWISSSYFDRGMNYKNSRLEVVSFSRLLDKYGAAKDFDAILLKCDDKYQGIVSVGDVRHYDLQLGINIRLSRGSDRPDWLKPLLIVVPDNMNPPFLERFLTANISELQFVRFSDYYEPLDKEILTGVSAELGRMVFKNNCLFCHSINGVGGNKGGSLLKKYNFRLDTEKRRFKETFLVMHGQDNASKQNMNQFLTHSNLAALSEFLSEMIKG